VSTEKTNTKTGLSEKSMSELLEEAIVEIAKAKEILRILFEEDLTEEEIVEFDTLTPEEEKVLRMRFGIAESLKGSLDNNVYKKEGQG
jgi:DNA-directed RNA polymerase sigma subunit (sigma70/sigma32)